MSNGFGGQVVLELGTHHPTAAMGTCDLAPDDPGLVGLATRGHRVPA